MKYTGRALLAAALLVAPYGLALIAVLMSSRGLASVVVQGPGQVSIFSWVLLVLSLSGLGLFAYAALRARRTRTGPLAAGVPLAQIDQPRLWAEVFALADKIKASPPDDIRLTAEPHVRIIEETRWSGLLPGPRHLAIGAPALLGLTSEQLRALIAHELGHQSADHRFSAIAHRGHDAAVRFTDAFDPDSWLATAADLLARAYCFVARPVTEDQEYAADEWAADVAGAKTTIAALRETVPLESAWTQFLTDYVTPGCVAGLHPEDLFGGFIEFLDDPERQAHLEAHSRRLSETDGEGGARAWHNAHPALTDRVAAVKALTTARSLDLSGPAEDILDDWSGALRAVQQLTYAAAGSQPASWAHLAEAGGRAECAQAAHQLVPVSEAIGVRPATLADVVEAVNIAKVPLLARGAAPDDSDLRRGDVAIRLSGHLVAEALVSAGRASFVHSWSAAPLLVDRQGEEIDPWSAISNATASSSGAELQAWLRSHRVPLHPPRPQPSQATYRSASAPAPTDPAPTVAVAVPTPTLEAPVAAPPTHAPVPDRVLALAAPIAGSTNGALLVSGTGISLRKARALGRRGPGVALGSVIEGARGERARLDTLPWAKIKTAEFTGLEDDRGVLTIRVEQERDRVVTFADDTQIEGDLLGALESLLGNRLLIS